MISLGDRVVHIAGITTRPDEAWMLQAGRNLTDSESGASGEGDVARPALRVFAATAEDLVAHEKVLDGIDTKSKGKCLWRQDTVAQTG